MRRHLLSPSPAALKAAAASSLGPRKPLLACLSSPFLSGVSRDVFSLASPVSLCLLWQLPHPQSFFLSWKEKDTKQHKVVDNSSLPSPPSSSVHQCCHFAAIPKKETGDALRMGKGLIICNSLGPIPMHSSDFSAKARPGLEEEGGGMLTPLSGHPTGV